MAFKLPEKMRQALHKSTIGMLPDPLPFREGLGPRLILGDRIKGSVEHGTNPGSSVLTAEEYSAFCQAIYSVWLNMGLH